MALLSLDSNFFEECFYDPFVLIFLVSSPQTKPERISLCNINSNKSTDPFERHTRSLQQNSSYAVFAFQTHLAKLFDQLPQYELLKKRVKLVFEAAFGKNF